eukprot:TRINITY_DN45603_c0_g1_i1.p1 TRINITY_DN45603_c0_g1~~TRINITY_DN45603_c0_g1_i1.p1  ORF type:complete len:240 (+),score=30.00 TRINITY_DN45603_c0_g1_i1:99-818(+)
MWRRLGRPIAHFNSRHYSSQAACRGGELVRTTIRCEASTVVVFRLPRVAGPWPAGQSTNSQSFQRYGGSARHFADESAATVPVMKPVVAVKASSPPDAHEFLARGVATEPPPPEPVELGAAAAAAAVPPVVESANVASQAAGMSAPQTPTPPNTFQALLDDRPPEKASAMDVVVDPKALAGSAIIVACLGAALCIPQYRVEFALFSAFCLVSMVCHFVPSVVGPLCVFLSISFYFITKV